MNVIYIHTHDTGRYIQPYGEPVETPNLMRFAESATLFRNAHCVGPTCSPSRSGLLTGMSPHNNGMLGLAHRGFQLDDYEKHLANFLKRNGYKTALSGIQHVAPDEGMIGYDHILGCSDKSVSKNDRDMMNAKAACDFIKSEHDKPFFLSFGMWNTHRKFPEQDKYNPDYVKVPHPIMDTKENREDMARFLSSAHFMDTCFGQVYQAIEEAGLRDRTILIFTTDHGIAFPHMKCNLTDTGTGVSLIMDFPSNHLKGRATDALVSHIDLYPTICELLEVDKPEWLQGKSMLPIFSKDEAINEFVYSEVSYHAAYEPKRAIRSNRYKLIRHYDIHKKPVPSNIDNCPSKDQLVESGYLEYTVSRERLYDLYIDPLERVNLIDDASYQGIYESLLDNLTFWQVQTDDPILLGQVAKPDGAIVNRLDCISPEADEFEEDGIR
ncbi:sulfatase [Acidaminobacter sp. JC074]|uniref:sulfatase family protein n=1 Tax=Acidaminobacter sp. JC074 TaxID=2530199 RepID=UPI001F0D1D9B|nr:sulfatase [Acidaminobacter sp. JC074]MCH4887614.1 sulfatase [Acidaminobacter sp. JC074]